MSDWKITAMILWVSDGKMTGLFIIYMLLVIFATEQSPLYPVLVYTVNVVDVNKKFSHFRFL